MFQWGHGVASKLKVPVQMDLFLNYMTNNYEKLLLS
jgi:hypothetical protein